MLSVGNLGIHAVSLAPGEERRLAGDGYYFLMLLQGQAYWLEDDSNAILEPGNLFVVPRGGAGCLRSGRFDETRLAGFVLCSSWLEGLLTLKEKMSLENWFETLSFPYMIAKNHPAAEFVHELGAKLSPGHSNDLSARIKSLEVLALLLKEIDGSRETAPPAVGVLTSCEARMRRYFDAITAVELRVLTLDSVAVSCGCSPRHAGRVFRRCFGASFRSKQAEIRMEKAAAMLAGGGMPIEAVAETCGFVDGQSLGLAFRRRYGLSLREFVRSKASESDSPQQVQS